MKYEWHVDSKGNARPINDEAIGIARIIQDKRKLTPIYRKTSPLQTTNRSLITGNTVRLRNPADDVVAIYKGPELKNTIIFFTNGTTVKILETGQGSYKIKVREYVGWVPEGVIVD